MANENKIARVITVGSSLAVILPARICRELHIRRAVYFSVQVIDHDRILLSRAKVVEQHTDGMQRDNNLDNINYGK